ncbi:MAG: glutamate-5-semialdehyde dehydrogenase [Oscillospiraceae bacterium]|nr:glutamate-5-semialdehyde dehydrogenase [Oscillospiraceae bacterium]
MKGEDSMTIEEIGRNAKTASRALAVADAEKKNAALYAMADALENNKDKILAANKADVDAARGNIPDAMLDRLSLTSERIRAMAKGMRDVAALPDPVGKILSENTRPNGIKIRKVSAPIGVIAIIYEARPNVTADSAALCLKSGNAVILKGGKEAANSNLAIENAMNGALEEAGLPKTCVQVLEDNSRETAAKLMRMNEYVDLLIPRGGSGLISAVVKNASVPVIQTGAGVCHTYVDKDADVKMAAEIIFNAKTSRPSVCNACDCMLVHKDIAPEALPVIADKLHEKNVEIRGDERVMDIISGCTPANEDDWGKEYLDYIISAHIVDDVDAAIAHITDFGTGHSECIVTENEKTAKYFMEHVDAAAVYHNASTRFTDGGEFGLGAEIGISTQKLHARGPMGLQELTSYKYMVFGNGQIR